MKDLDGTRLAVGHVISSNYNYGKAAIVIVTIVCEGGQLSVCRAFPPLLPALYVNFHPTPLSTCADSSNPDTPN